MTRPMANSSESVDTPETLGPALALVRAVWADGGEGGLPDRAMAWAMMIEAVDRLTALDGPAAMAGLLERLSLAVRETPRAAPGAIQ